jgi:PleD family two-component response regulator
MKTAPKLSDIKSLLATVANGDIDETLRANGELEDKIFQQLERLQALTAMQYRADTCETLKGLPNRAAFSELMDEQVRELRRLIDRYFG